MRALLLLAGTMTWTSMAAAEPIGEQSDELPPVEVTGQPSPFDSQKPRLERGVPCVGTCEEIQDQADGIVKSVLGFLVLPAEPPDNRDMTPISLRQPRDRLQDKQP